LPVSALRPVYDEFCAQIEHLARLDVPLSHIDSHHHIHTKPELFPVLKAVQQRYRIRRVRIAKNIYLGEAPVRRSLLLRKIAFNWALANIYRTRTTEGFTEATTLMNLTRGRAKSCATIEVMVHPGAAGDSVERPFYDTWLEAPPTDVQLISYDEL